ncbi:hypothetical protein [Sphaerotilus sp.]|uniref:hypothetical protein n=1 Tax=Sphaerotilus sp. TaxID=2093942 RepID=UPI00286DA8F0|nr:hypothetical protein [Sphaerotilus sp.]
MNLIDILAQATGSHHVSDQQFDQVAQAAPSDLLAQGLASAFRSSQTPDIGAMVGQLFGGSSGTQQAGMLNQILATLGPVAAAALANGALGRIMAPGSSQITPAQASQLSPQETEAIVAQAHAVEPGIADKIASFYAEHPALVKTLGGLAMAVALSKMKDHLAQR